MKFHKIEEEIKQSHRKFLMVLEMEKKMMDKGYLYTEPILLEDYDQFVEGNNRINNQSTVKVLSNNGNISILTADITAGIVSNIMDKSEKDMRAKIFYNGKVFYNTTLGIREIRKLGAEYLGEEGILADLEILDLVFSILDDLSQDYILEISCSQFLKQILKEFALGYKEYRQIMELIYKKDQYELNQYLQQQKNEHGKFLLSELFQLYGTYEDLIEKLKSLYADPKLVESIVILKKIDQYYKERQIKGNIVFDLSMVTEWDYYTGVVFRGYIKGINEAVIKGGRYKTSSQKTSRELHAVGFSIEIDHLMKGQVETCV